MQYNMLNKKDSIAVIDIGSNSVRLCVFRGNMRSPDVLYNKKFFCGLGEFIPETQLISKEAEKKCINSIIFFNSIIDEMKPSHSVALCTAAIRNASNKKEITNKIQKVFKGKVITLSGRQEAAYATLGVRSAIPSANGTIIDMGGGSLELAQITPHKIKNISSFPLGILNFTKEHKEHKKINKEINSKHKNQKNFYLIGGAFRSIARCYIYFNKLPLNEIHNLSISRKNFYELKSDIQKIGFDDLQKIPKISVDRIKHIHIAIEVLDKVLKLSNCEQFIYPRYGIREGFIYEKLSKKQRLLDPTEISLELIAKSRCRFLIFNKKTFAWIKNIYLKFINLKISSKQLRVIKLSCIISDLGWEQTAKIRASYALNLILNSPLVGIEQSEKVFIAYLVYLRHTKNILDQRVIEKELSTYLSYLSSDEKKLAYQIGCVLNFLYSITKGSSFLLKQLDLKSITLGEQKKVSSIQKVPKSGKTEQLYNLIRKF